MQRLQSLQEVDSLPFLRRQSTRNLAVLQLSKIEYISQNACIMINKNSK